MISMNRLSDLKWLCFERLFHVLLGGDIGTGSWLNFHASLLGLVFLGMTGAGWLDFLISWLL